MISKGVSGRGGITEEKRGGLGKHPVSGFEGLQGRGEVVGVI